MEGVGPIRIIRSISDAPIKEYIKDFFRFIGCIVSDCQVEESSNNRWQNVLQPDNEKKGVDIVLNCTVEDQYLEKCKVKGIKRIYVFYKLDDKAFSISTNTQFLIANSTYKKATIKETRKKILELLVEEIWSDISADRIAVFNILKLYTDNEYGDLFYLIKAKKCMRVLGMSEILQDPEVRVPKIHLHSYLKRVICGLWKVYVQLEDHSNYYCTYARINAAAMLREMLCKIYDNDYEQLNDIIENDRKITVVSAQEIANLSKELFDNNQQNGSAYLMMANLDRLSYSTAMNEMGCYAAILQMLPNNQQISGFIWYKIGCYYEKVRHDTDSAIKSYHLACQNDGECYQALFKLGLYAALDGRFNEAESILNKMIRDIFAGRNVDSGQNGEYDNWRKLTLKESQYVFKAYILLAKIAINSSREFSAKASIGKACIAATIFEDAALIRDLSDKGENDYLDFIDYHKKSDPVWAMWRVLKPWSYNIIHDEFVKNIVSNRLAQWSNRP